MKIYHYYPYLLLCSVALFSCSNGDVVTEYTFGKTRITRIDNDGITHFYSGVYKSVEEGHKPCMSVAYYGRNNCMDAFLIFKKNKTVEILPYGCGNFEKMGDCKINIREYRNDSLDYVLKDFRDSSYGVIRISNCLEVEKSFRENEESRVVTRYY